jgi:trehalose-phosphatase
VNSDLYSRVERICRRGPVLIATDFDGTLTPIVQTPEAASLSRLVLHVLRRLNSTPGCTLMIVTGRSLDDIRVRVPLPCIWAGNHGLEIEGPGFALRHPAAIAMRRRLESACLRLSQALRLWPGATVESKGLTATVHYRQVRADQQRAVRLIVRRTMAIEGNAFGLRSGKMAIEIYPKTDWDKGSAVQWARQRLGLTEDACICIGDDRTDESMFRRCPGAITVAVGAPRLTAAEFLVGEPDEVHALLASAADFMNPLLQQPLTNSQRGSGVLDGEPSDLLRAESRLPHPGHEVREQ